MIESCNNGGCSEGQLFDCTTPVCKLLLLSFFLFCYFTAISVETVDRQTMSIVGSLCPALTDRVFSSPTASAQGYYVDGGEQRLASRAQMVAGAHRRLESADRLHHLSTRSGRRDEKSPCRRWVVLFCHKTENQFVRPKPIIIVDATSRFPLLFPPSEKRQRCWEGGMVSVQYPVKIEYYDFFK